MTTPSRTIIAVALATLAALTAVVYWPGIHGGFVLDDYRNIVDNPSIHIHDLHWDTVLAAAFSSSAGIFGRPLSMLSFALNEFLWGSSPYSMKLTNIVIHVVNGLLVYTVAALLLMAYKRRFRAELTSAAVHWTAISIAAAWLLLPINLTAVLYVVQRMTSLAATFTLLGLALYTWGRLRMLEGHRGLWMLWLAMLVCGPLAVLSKEVGALLPVYALVIEWTLFKFQRASGDTDRRLYVLYGMLLVVPGILGLLWAVPKQLGSAGTYATRPFTLGERLLTEPRIFLDYIVWALAPNPHALSLYHDDVAISHGLAHPATTWVAIMIVIGLLTGALFLRRRQPLASLGIFWFFAGQLLTGTVFSLELAYEHRNYLPTVGLLTGLFSFVLLQNPTERLALARRGLVVGLIVIYGVVTEICVQQWSNPLLYAAIAAREHPNSPRATYGLGEIYARLVDSRDSKFLPLANAALRKAATVPQPGILPEAGLLVLNSREGKPLQQSWWHTMIRKLSRNPASPQDTAALYSMIKCETAHLCHLPKEHLTTVLSTAISRNPNDPNLIAIAGIYAANLLHNYGQAHALMVRSVQLKPRSARYRLNLINLDIFMKRFRDAHREIAKLNSLNLLGNLDKAIANAQRQLTTAIAANTSNRNREIAPKRDDSGQKPVL